MVMLRFIYKLFLVCIFVSTTHGVCTALSNSPTSSIANEDSMPANRHEFLRNTDGAAILCDYLDNNTPSKNKSAQIKVTPASGSYLGGCSEDGYYVKISGESFGNGWDISSVTICGVEVCQIVMQSSDMVIVYPGAGSPGTGDVVITSKSMGKTIIEKAFTYENSTPSKESKNSKYTAVSQTVEKTR